MNDNVYSKIGIGVKAGNVIQRYFLYIFVIVTIVFLLWLIALSGELNSVFHALEIHDKWNRLYVLFLPPMLIIILWERCILNYRRKLGVSLYADITEELQQLNVNERVAREKKAFEINGVNQGVDKNDIGYWHGLLKSGAITEEEYEVKKKELM